MEGGGAIEGRAWRKQTEEEGRAVGPERFWLLIGEGVGEDWSLRGRSYQYINTTHYNINIPQLTPEKPLTALGELVFTLIKSHHQ